MEGASIKEVIIEVEILVEGAVEYFFEAGAAGIDGVYLWTSRQRWIKTDLFFHIPVVYIQKVCEIQKWNDESPKSLWNSKTRGNF